MYKDNQKTSPNSAPGLGVNLAGNNFRNSYKTDINERNFYMILSGSNAEGFEKLHYKTNGTQDTIQLHLFTDKNIVTAMREKLQTDSLSLKAFS